MKAKQQNQKQKDTENIIQHEEKTFIRLNKFISNSGYCSRREADRLIEAGKVRVDDKIAQMGLKVTNDNKIEVEGHIIASKKNKIYLALNKPVGITCTTDQSVKGNLTDFMNYPEIIFPIGRLDKESTGLLLMTNDGDIVNKILREENGHDKEYLVTVDREVTPEFIKKMESGVTIYNLVANKYQKTLPCTVKQVGKKSFLIILRQGMNRQIRRMTKELGYKVVSLERKRVMNIHLKNLGIGQWRYLTKEELQEMNDAIHGN